MRGTADITFRRFSDGRITPADAGNSGLGSWIMEALEDHPRGCGEQSVIASPSSMIYGSPPRMRGTDKKCHVRNTYGRITPADAGNSMVC